MSVTLDGQKLFDGQRLDIEAESLKRSSIEREAAGLDGVVSIDLGKRSRKVKQNGDLRAVSRSLMDDRVSAISAYMDGDSHTLIVDGQTYNNLRMDVFKVKNKRAAGSGVVCDYEIVYTQLA